MSIQTVNGIIADNDCKMVLSHEHLFIDLSNQAAPEASLHPVTAADRAQLMCDPYAIKDNLLINDFAAAKKECEALVSAGCNLVVDCTTSEIGRNPALLKQLSDTSGINIVMGCGFYTGDTHTEAFNSVSVDEAVENLLAEITGGVNGIKPGVIGEIGTSAEILPGEYKALQIAAKAHLASGLAVQIHIYPWSQNGLEAAGILLKSGVAPEKIVICHSDVELNTEYIFKLLKLGVYVEFDNFGKEFTPAEGGFSAGRFALDKERCRVAAEIIRQNYGGQLLLTNDICLKCMLAEFGGAGYRHIFDNIVPMLTDEGVEKEYIQEIILRQNPLKMLALS